MSDNRSDSNSDRIFLYLDRVHEKLDTLDNRSDSIDKTLVKIQLDVEYHIKRTNLLEQAIDDVRKDVKPLQKHIVMTEAVVKIFAAVSACAVLLVTIFKLVGAIK